MKKLIPMAALLVIAGVGIWWVASSKSDDSPARPHAAALPTPPTPEKKPPAHSSAVASLPPSANGNQPNAASVASPAAPPSQAPTGANSAADARAGLDTAVKDMIGLLDANDVGGFILKYASPKALAGLAQSFSQSRAKAAEFRSANNLPQLPEQSFEDSIRALGSTALAPYGKILLTELKGLQALTPKLNAAGDEATFTLDPALSANLPGNPETITLHQENGHWYADALLPN